MSRAVYVLRDGVLVEKHLAPPLHDRSDAPYISPDGMGMTLEHTAFADGRSTDSKSQYRRWTQEAGCVEKGNDREAPRSQYQSVTREEVATAAQMVNQGYRPYQD